MTGSNEKQTIQGRTIRSLRARFRIAPEAVATPLGMTRDELLDFEEKNLVLTGNAVAAWQAVASFLRKSKGHIRRAPLKELPFARPECQECHLQLHCAIDYFSKRLGQNL